MNRCAAIALLALSLFATACGSPDPAGTDVPAPSASAMTATSEPVTSTIMPTTSTTEATPESWDLIVFGDSFAAKRGWPAQFAAMAAAELGVTVSVDGNVCFGGCTALTGIRNSEATQDLIAEAEIIVIQPQPGRVVAPLWRSYSLGDCGGGDGLACFRDAEAGFREYVEELFDEVIALSEPGTIIRAAQATGTWALDSFHPGLRDTAPDQFDAFLDNMLILSAHIAQAAADRCILVVDVNAIMSGPDYRQPVDPDYSDDGSHPSEEGSRVIAEALRSLGYQGTAGSC